MLLYKKNKTKKIENFRFSLHKKILFLHSFVLKMNPFHMPYILKKELFPELVPTKHWYNG